MKEKVIKKIQEAFLSEKVEEAERLYQDFFGGKEWDDEVIYILDASIGECIGDKERMWEAIRKGLLINPKNPELYILLGNYYMNNNLTQAYICYENALFYCVEEADKEQIIETMYWLIQQGVVVRKTSFVILSYNQLDYTKLCINSIRATVPKLAREIIVVDNASQDGSVDWLKEQSDVILVTNKENVGFPKGCNQGIEVASKDTDIFLLNNDTILTTNSLFWLRIGLYEDSKNGTVGSVSNYVGNFQQVSEQLSEVSEWLVYGEKNNTPMKYPFEKKLFLIGFALLIRREIIDSVGGLDERFSPGNSEDEDYGLRVLTAGYYNVLCKNSFIFHFGSVSFGKDKKHYYNLLRVNHQKLNDKWGANMHSYLYPRQELISLIAEPMEKEFNVLNVGCGCGATLSRIKGEYPNASLYGIELIDGMARYCACEGEIINVSPESMDIPWQEKFFDYIVLGNVLERLCDPEKVLNKMKKYLKAGGYIIASISNIKHFSVMLPLLQDDLFSYNDTGILNQTHLKMYTGTEIAMLLFKGGFEMEYWGYTTNGSPNTEEKEIINILNSISRQKDETEYLVYQYIAKAKQINK